MFALETMTPAKVLDVRVLSQKNRKPDENPGAKLVFQVTLPDSALDSFDSALRQIFFMAAAKAAAKGKKQPKQEELEGVEVVSDTPDLTSVGEHVPVLKWVQEFTGYHLAIDRSGRGDRRSQTLVDDSVLSEWYFRPKKGGTFVAKFTLESENVSEVDWGKLAKLKRRDVKITLMPPEITQQSIDTLRGDPDEFFKGPDNPFGSTDAAEAAKGGRKPKPAKPGQEVTPTDAFINSQPPATQQ